MARVIYDLILDESGSFAADNRLGNSTEFSLVGGLLCKQSYLTDQLVNTLLPERVHCKDKYKKEYLSVLEKLYADGCRFVIFENQERLKIINSDVTYLNVMSEGLIQVLHDLRLAYPDDQIIVMITIALRKEVSASYGVIKQDEYRCALLLAAGKTEEAMNMLLMVYNRTSGPEDFDKFVTKVWGDKNRKDVFPIWHYTNVMLAMLDTDAKKAEEMYTALNKCKNFTTDLQKGGLDGYPWNMILWNMSRWYRRTASAATADKYYKQALAITREHPEHLTMCSFSISMVADYLLHQLRKGEIKEVQAEKEMRKVCEEFGRMLYLAWPMNDIFVPKKDEKIDEKVLERLSNAWLR